MDKCSICERVFGTKQIDGVGVLQTFKSYTVDFRLKQFRKVPLDASPEFIDFDSPKGEQLGSEMHEVAVNELSKRYS
jgi:hypothetical protein